ncbi:MAG: peptidoglycan DD-metalloendopeptidase family protein [Allobaculum sp.]|nr:peptidoglycan DD-metalloendopeptidase family protein [Allobaculum sp.]
MKINRLHKKRNWLNKFVVASACSSILFPINQIQIQATYDGLGPVVIHGGKRDMQWPVPNYPNIQSCFYDHRNHRAIDIAAPQGTSVVAAYNGTVVEVYNGGTGTTTGYGNYVVVQHNYVTANGAVSLYTRYNHLSATKASVGQNVSRGETIGFVGMTGYAEGNHLDFQVYNGPWNNTANSIDPFSNQLLELPTGIVVYDSWDCGPDYLNRVKSLYSTPLDTQAPVISDIQIVKDKTGYTVTCRVDDESGIEKVIFPTWTLYGDQDDLDPNWLTSSIYLGKLEGNKASFRVNISAHNNELGIYATDIYAFDKYGNAAWDRRLVDMNEPEPVKKLTMYRLYNSNSGEHFFTSSKEEKDALAKLGWLYEGIGWYAPEKSDKPVYRLYHPVVGDHHYTMDKNEVDYNTTYVGWKNEGIGWYSADSSGQPVYRQFAPLLRTGSHNYTTNPNERDTLVSLGWVDEGIAWYGLK